MKQKSLSHSLDEKIYILESRQSHELQLLKTQFHDTYESIKPLNLLKSTIREITHSTEIKNNMVKSLVGLTAGYISRKVITGSSSNIFRNLAGTALQYIVTNMVSKRSENEDE